MFGLRAQVRRLRDSRRRPQIATSCVWLCAFGMFALRFRSFNAFEQELRRPRVWEAWVGPRKPSADTLGRVLSHMDLAQLRGLMLCVHRRMWRAKALRMRAGRRMRVVAVDGHELFASRARHCSRCLSREVTTVTGTVTQYYHRVVTAQWVDVSVPVVLDVEPINPGEGEVVAARRLLDRLLASYGRLIDVITGDALYLEAPFCRQVQEAGKYFIVVMKQEARELYRDADGLRTVVTPSQLENEGSRSRVWDLEGLTSFSTLRTPVRVVWTEDEHTKARYVGGRKVIRTETHRWVWATNLPRASVPAATVARWGHHRWDIENCGFNEMAALWSMDHCFVHHPTAIVALLLTLALAMAMTYLFYERNLKSEVRRHLSRLTLAGRFREDIAASRGISLWPMPEPDG
jgi:hypothetical protein